MDTIHFILDVSGYRSEMYMSNDFSPIRECSTEVINDVLRTNILVECLVALKEL